MRCACILQKPHALLCDFHPSMLAFLDAISLADVSQGASYSYCMGLRSRTDERFRTAHGTHDRGQGRITFFHSSTRARYKERR